MEAELRTILLNLQKGQDQLHAKFDQLSAEVKTLDGKFNKLDAKVDKLEAKVDSNHEQVTAQFAEHSLMLKAIREGLDIHHAKTDADTAALNMKSVLTEVKFQEVQKNQAFLREKIYAHELELFFLKKYA